MHTSIPVVEASDLVFEAHRLLPQPVEVRFFPFFSSAFAQHSCLGFPTALQDSQKVPQLAHPISAIDQLVLPKLHQLCKFPSDPLPLVAYAFYISGRC